MKKSKVTTAIMVMAIVSLTAISCKNSNKESTTHMQTEMNSSNTKMDSDVQSSAATQVLESYMELKDALIATDEKTAADAGKKLESALKDFNVDDYTPEQIKELSDIIEVAIEHAEHISRSDISHQREHFQMLSNDMIDMVAITGTNHTLYQQHCPMYADGGTWLSLEKKVSNPYYGSKMMNCGEVQKVIN